MRLSRYHIIIALLLSIVITAVSMGQPSNTITPSTNNPATTDQPSSAVYFISNGSAKPDTHLHSASTKIVTNHAWDSGIVPIIHSINVEGSTNISQNMFQQLMTLTPGSRFYEFILRRDIYRILDYYKSHGYYFAAITLTQLKQIRHDEVDITLFIDEGPQLYWDSISIYGNFLFSDREIMNIIGVFPKDPFDALYLESGLDILIQVYDENMLPNAVVSISELSASPETGACNLVLNIDEGGQIEIAGFKFIGVSNNLARSLQKELKPLVGEYLNQYILREIKQRMEALEFISINSITSKASTNAGSTIIIIDCTVLKSSSLLVNFGFSGNQIDKHTATGQPKYAFNISGVLDFKTKNFFNTGRGVGVYYSPLFKEIEVPLVYRKYYGLHKLGIWKTEFRFFYNEPWIFSIPLGLSSTIHLYQEELTPWSFQGTSTNRLPIQKKQNPSIKEELTGRFSSRYHASVVVSWERVRYTREYASYKNTETISVGHISRFQHLDNYRNPRRGYRHTFEVYFKPYDIRDKRYMIIEHIAQMSYYIMPAPKSEKWFQRVTLFLRPRWRWVSWNEQEIPYQEYLSFGGAATLRGYKEAQFRVLWNTLVNTEFRYHIDRASFFYLFMDNAYFRAYTGTEMLSNTITKQLYTNYQTYGWGFGIAMNVRIGTIQISYGIGEGKSATEGKIHLILVALF